MQNMKAIQNGKYEGAPIGHHITLQQSKFKLLFFSFLPVLSFPFLSFLHTGEKAVDNLDVIVLHAGTEAHGKGVVTGEAGGLANQKQPIRARLQQLLGQFARYLAVKPGHGHRLIHQIRCGRKERRKAREEGRGKGERDRIGQNTKEIMCLPSDACTST